MKPRHIFAPPSGSNGGSKPSARRVTRTRESQCKEYGTCSRDGPTSNMLPVPSNSNEVDDPLGQTPKGKTSSKTNFFQLACWSECIVETCLLGNLKQELIYGLLHDKSLWLKHSPLAFEFPGLLPFLGDSPHSSCNKTPPNGRLPKQVATQIRRWNCGERDTLVYCNLPACVAGCDYNDPCD